VTTVWNATHQTQRLLLPTLVEIRDALSASHRTQPRVRKAIARLEEIAQSTLPAVECACRSENDLISPGCTPRIDTNTTESLSLLEQIQGLCILARSGVETDGWWQALDKRFSALESSLLQEEAATAALSDG
jgi:hypothetical protein